MKEKIKKIRELVQSGRELTTKTLKEECGIYGATLYRLVKTGTLERVANIRGKYVVKDLSILNIPKNEKKKEINVSLNMPLISDHEVSEINKIFTLLQNNNEEEATKNMIDYLKRINKKEYYYYLLCLIKLAKAINDKTYIDFLKALNSIAQNNFVYDISPYARLFFVYGRMGNIEAAKICLEIIKGSRPFTRAYEIAYNLEDALSYYENREKERKQNIIKKIEYVVAENGIMTLDVSGDERKIIKAYVISNKKLSYFEIDSLLVIIESDNVKNYQKISRLEADNEFKNNEFSKAISQYRELLRRNPKDYYNYEQLGLCHYYLGNLKIALEFLESARYLAREAGKIFNYDGIIVTIYSELEQSNSDNKKSVEIRNFGFNESKTILELIANGEDIKTIVTKCNIKDNMINYIYLLIAEYYYSIEAYEIGDSYIEKVILMDSNSAILKRDIEEVLTNRLSYKNIQNRQLVRA